LGVVCGEEAMNRVPAMRPTPLHAYVSVSSRELGFEIARQLAADGAHVALSSRRTSHLDAARTAIVANTPNARVLTIPGDLSCVEDQERIFATLDDENFSPDVFVCNAGHPNNTHLSSLSRTDWEAILR